MTLKDLRELLEDYSDYTPVSIRRERLRDGIIFIGTFLRLQKLEKATKVYRYTGTFKGRARKR